MPWKKQIVKFGIVGLTSSFIDFVVYAFFLFFLGVIPSFSKVFGFVSGSLFGFVFNRKWTFRSQKSKKSTILPFAVLYIVSLTLNVVVNSGVLFLFGKSPSFIYLLAFILATGTSALTNFLGLKFIVFKSKTTH